MAQTVTKEVRFLPRVVGQSLSGKERGGEGSRQGHQCPSDVSLERRLQHVQPGEEAEPDPSEKMRVLRSRGGIL